MTENLVDEAPVREEIVPGVARALSPMVRRILATNPSVKTGLGTNTYLVGIDEIAIVDPGPLDDEHLRSITGCGGDLIRWIILTNTDPHHAAAAVELKKRTGATLMSMEDYKGADAKLTDGEQIVGTEFRLTVKHLPGPSDKNIGLMLEEERTLLSGDLIVEGTTVAITPPQGDMTKYLASLESLKKLRLRKIAPAHGYVIENPKEVIAEYIEHRLAREKQILKAVSTGAARVEKIVDVVYADVELEPERRELAEGTVHSHLLKLRSEGSVKGQKNWAIA